METFGTVGKRIAYARKKAGIRTQKQLAALVNELVGFVTRNIVVNWETDRTVPTEAQAAAIARVTGFDYSFFVDEVESAEPDKGLGRDEELLLSCYRELPAGDRLALLTIAIDKRDGFRHTSGDNGEQTEVGNDTSIRGTTRKGSGDG